MKRSELLELIDEGENLNVEFKLRFSSFEKIAKELIAFANIKGGFLLFGIDDDKKIVGVQSEKEEAELAIESAKNYCEPEVEIEIDYKNIDDKEIVIVHIPESNNKPHRLQDYKNNLELNSAQVYIRVKDKSVLASKEMIKVLQSQTSKTYLKNYFIGNLERKIFEYFQSNETLTVKILSDLVNISQRRASRALINLVRANLLLIHSKENGESYFTIC